MRRRVEFLLAVIVTLVLVTLMMLTTEWCAMYPDRWRP